MDGHDNPLANGLKGGGIIEKAMSMATRYQTVARENRQGIRYYLLNWNEG